MKKIFLLLCLCIPLNIDAAQIPKLNSTHAIIYDNTDNEILYELNSDEKTSIASLTKIMTALVAIEEVSDLNSEIIITKKMLQGLFWNAAKAGFKVGEKVTYYDLLYAALLPSGADATYILAYAISGSLNAYVDKMNNLARALNLNNTHFTNVVGLDNKEHYSTLKDIVKLLKYALKNPTFKMIYTTKEKVLTNGLLVESTLNKANQRMNLDLSRIIGSKTGMTDDAGYCLSSLIESKNHEIILITTGAKRIETNYYHIIDTLNLIKFTDELREEMIKNNIEIENSTLIEKNNTTKKEIKIDKKVLIIGIFLSLVIIHRIARPSKKI